MTHTTQQPNRRSVGGYQEGNMNRPIVIEPGMACVRQAGAWWNVSVLLNISKQTIVCPSSKSELEAKNFVSYYYPNCETFLSQADMIAEIRRRRSPDYGGVMEAEE